MIGGIFKKLVGKTDKNENAGARLATKLRDKSEKFSNFLGDKFEQAKNEILEVRAKCSNLRETNYRLGLKHLEKGNLSDAIFRFRFIKKFWPDLFDAQYQLAYCLILDNKAIEAKQELEELLSRQPNFDPKARDLLEHINSSLEQPSQDA